MGGGGLGLWALPPSPTRSYGPTESPLSGGWVRGAIHSTGGSGHAPSSVRDGRAGVEACGLCVSLRGAVCCLPGQRNEAQGRGAPSMGPIMRGSVLTAVELSGTGGGGGGGMSNGY